MATTNQYTLDFPEGNANQKTVNVDSEIEDVFDQLPTPADPEPNQHNLFRHCMPPDAPIYHFFSVFLAGSIEMGAAIQWQKQLASLLSPLPITVNNPRRGDWDITATQEAENAAFSAQVEWELTALEKSDVICFFFDVNTKSPVTLLEFGLWAHSGKVVVCCNKRYWRSGNVHLVCERYNIPYVESFGELVPAVTRMLGEKGMQLDENGNLVGSS
jgi:nucleoside 2-deoxyribosyltransferase